MPARVVHFEDIEEGSEGPGFKIENMTRTNIVRYAGASGDFNPIHHDEPYVQSVGYPGVFAMGMMAAGYLSRLPSDWFGLGQLRRYHVRFVSQVWPRDTLTFKGKVARKYEQDGEGMVDVDLVVENQKGEPVITGKATAALPHRSERR
jgi:acyl dehydratase